jgi:tagatose 1,6-diphosphate aldolase GatY/KbaY
MGHYRGTPVFDLARLAAIRQAVAVPLVLHGASGVPNELVRQTIGLGVRKLNVNTELRAAYIAALQESLRRHQSPDVLPVMQLAVTAMQTVVADKLRLFGSVQRARESDYET